MPLITKAEFLTKAGTSSTRATIAQLEDDLFDDLELQASQIVIQKTGIAIPADASSAPEWVKMPMVLIMTYFYAGDADSISEVQQIAMNTNYKRALDMLDGHTSTGESSGGVFVVPIEGLSNDGF